MILAATDVESNSGTSYRRAVSACGPGTPALCVSAGTARGAGAAFRNSSGRQDPVAAARLGQKAPDTGQKPHTTSRSGIRGDAEGNTWSGAEGGHPRDG